METAFAKPTRRGLSGHFSVIKDTRQPCKVMYPLPEVLLPVVGATIAGRDGARARFFSSLPPT